MSGGAPKLNAEVGAVGLSVDAAEAAVEPKLKAGFAGSAPPEDADPKLNAPKAGLSAAGADSLATLLRN